MTHHSPFFLRSALSAAAIATVCLHAGAQTAQLEIAAQPLADGLAQLGRQSGAQIVFAPELVSGLRGQAVQGLRDVDSALAEMLRGTGLQPRRSGSILTLERVPQAATPTLAPVTVVGQAPHESAWGPVNGYTAQRSATGSKTDTAILEIPQSISVVSAAQIEAQQPSSLVDALGYSAGVVRSEGSDRTTDSFVIRGFQAGPSSGSLYRDGSKFMVNSYDGQQELYGLERVELLKGAASLLYGTAAPGGVINTISKRPTAEPLHEIGVELGNYKRKQLKADFGGALNEDGSLSYRLTGLLRDSDTFTDYVPDDRRFLSAALAWKPSASTSLTLQAEYLHNRTNYSYGLPAEGTIAFNPNGRIASNFYNGLPGYDKYEGTNTALGYLFEHAFANGLTLRNSAHVFRSNVSFPSSYGDGLSADQSSTDERGAQDRQDFSRAYTTDTSLAYSFASGSVQHTLLAGVDTTYQYHTTRRFNRDVDEPLNYFAPDYRYTLGSASFFPYYPDTSSNDTGLYLQDQMKIDQRWVLVLGGRHDMASDRQMPVDGVTANSRDTTSANTGRAGLVYLADNGLAPFISFSQSFQPITGVDRFGARFKPTQGEQYEAGLRYQPPGSETQLSAAVYQLTQQNVQSTDPVDTNFSVQTGEIRSRGLELEAKTRIAKALTLVAAYAYTDARVTADSDSSLVGKRRGLVPYNTASVWGEYDFAAQGLPGLQLGLGARYVGSTLGLYVDGTVPSYRVLDAMLAYQTGPWRLALNLNNLADKEYIASCTYACFYGERRKAVFSAVYRW